MLYLALYFVLAYLIGSIMGGQIAQKLMGGVDIRTTGSGNLGATNALRSRGAGFGVVVLLIDVLKGVVAVLLLPTLGLVDVDLQVYVVPLCALGAFLGHVYSWMVGFKGGKGVATLAGILLAAMPWGFLGFGLTWLLVLVLTGYVALASMLGALAVSITLLLCGAGLASPLFWFALFVGLFTCYTHRDNIGRLRRGEEHQFQRVMLFKRT